MSVAWKTETAEFLAFFIGMVHTSNENTENHDVKNTNFYTLNF